MWIQWRNDDLKFLRNASGSGPVALRPHRCHSGSGPVTADGALCCEPATWLAVSFVVKALSFSINVP